MKGPCNYILPAMVLLLLSASTASAWAQYPARCSGPCGRYFAYARGAGAMGTLGPLMSMYQQCQACINRRGTTRRRVRRRRCKKGYILRGKYCLPKGSSQCPKQRSRHCAAPNICATDLSGEDRCFTKSGLQQLKAQKIRREREIKAATEKARLQKHIASRKARDSALARSFKQRYHMDYAQWLDKLRQLTTLLQKIPAEQTEQRRQAQADIQAVVSPPMSKELPPPAGNGLERLKSGKMSAHCSRNFDLSELWDHGFKMHNCTSKGWVIARSDNDDTSPARCIALHPDGTLMMVLKRSMPLPDKKLPPHFTTQMTVRELKTESWLLGEGDMASLRIMVDDKVLFNSREKIEVSTKPPLRYSFSTKTKGIDLDALAAGNKTVVTIADKQWSMSLRGSAAAIKSMKFCAYGASVGRNQKVNRNRRTRRKRKASRASMCRKCGTSQTSCDKRCMRRYTNKTLGHNGLIRCYTRCGAYKRLDACHRKYCR